MRLRSVITIAFVVVALVVGAFQWWQVFPFRDGIVEFLPEGAIAYVHINLTAAIRHQIEAQSSRIKDQIGEDFADALVTALRSREVSELGVVWYKSESLPPQFAFIIGQRASARPDVVPATTMTVGGQDARVFVVRIQSYGGRGLGRQPIQATLWPRALPIPALEAARRFAPETLSAAGTIDRHGFTLRSDDRRPRFRRDVPIPLLAPPQVGVLQVLGFPIREAINGITAPIHGEHLAMIAATVPETVDALVARDGFMVRLSNDDFTNERTQTAIRAVVARLFPFVRVREFDGVPATIEVADPSSIAIESSGAGRWVIRAHDGDAVFVGRSGDGFAIASNAAFLKATTAPHFTIRVPAQCARPSPSGDVILFIPTNPQLTVFSAISRDGSSFTICGGYWDN